MKVYVGHSLRQLGPTGHSYLQDPEYGRDQEFTKQCKLWRQDGEGKVVQENGLQVTTRTFVIEYFIIFILILCTML